MHEADICAYVDFSCAYNGHVNWEMEERVHSAASVYVLRQIRQFYVSKFLHIRSTYQGDMLWELMWELISLRQ